MNKWNAASGEMYGAGRAWRLESGREAVIVYLGRNKYALVCLGVSLVMPEGSEFRVEQLPGVLKSAQYLGEVVGIKLKESGL